jgi:hypothetical protein
MELSSDVKNAVHANRKIDAIKRLRVEHNWGLKEAKDIIDNYIEENRHLIVNQRAARDSGFGRVLAIVILGCVIYAAYRTFS